MTQNVYKKFSTASEIYSFIRKKFPKVRDWGCRGPINGTGPANTRVWPEEFYSTSNEQAFKDALQYVCRDFFNGDTIKPGFVVEISENSGSDTVGYVELMKPSAIPDVYKFSGQTAFDKVLADGANYSFNPASDFETYKVLFERNPDLNTPKNRKLIANKILNQLINKGTGYAHWYNNPDHPYLENLEKYLTSADIDKLVKTCADKLEKNTDLEAVYSIIEAFTPPESGPTVKSLYSAGTLKLLKQMKAKMDAAQKINSEKAAQAKKEREEQAQRDRAEAEQQKQLKIQQDKERTAQFVKSIPSSELEKKVRANPGLVWDLPKGEQSTKDMWVVAAQMRPDILTFAPADIKAYVAQHGPKGITESSHIHRLTKLAGLK